jgi:uncharacterized protein YbjT (DUF2867 family)
MRVAVTGATGFTGRRVVRELLARGHDVSALVRPPLERPAEALPRGVRVVGGDMSDQACLRALIADADAFLHVASLGFGHAEGITRVIAQSNVKRAVFFSSTSLFTTLPARSKAERRRAEDFVRGLDVPWTILRPTMIYGDEGDRNISRMIRFLARTPLVPLPGGGRALIQPVHVEDLGIAAASVIESPLAARRTYNVPGAEAAPLRDVIGFLLRELGRRAPIMPLPLAPMTWAVRAWSRLRLPPRLTVEQVLRLAEDKAFSFDEARADWGYAPRGYREGLRAEIARLRAIGWLP